MPTTVAPRPQADPDLSRTCCAPMLEALWRGERLLVGACWWAPAGVSTAQAEEALGARTVERHQCTHVLDPRCAGTLRDHGLRFTGHDDGHPCVVELPGYRFFLSTLFRPEVADDTFRLHPLVRGFASAAAVGRSTGT
ncbi:hypothetical protein [Streptomyces cyaneofuscatus]|uniref:hypothetical protein n=1 Tax=Streptomyces cyaneofuscatus TaxID=66883 RepID=UPI00365FCDFD